MLDYNSESISSTSNNLINYSSVSQNLKETICLNHCFAKTGDFQVMYFLPDFNISREKRTILNQCATKEYSA